LVLRPKPKNRRCDFETQITKPKIPILRPKSGNPPAPYFLGSNKKPTASFEAKSGEIVATSFKAKLEKTVITGFEVKPEKTITAGFETKPLETVTIDFEAKPVKTVTIGFEAQTDEKSYASTLVLRLNQETCAPPFHVNGGDRTRRHPTSRSFGHQVPDLCTRSPTISGPLHQVSYFCHNRHRCTPYRTCHLHTTR
jgi:hypothetical protein